MTSSTAVATVSLRCPILRDVLVVELGEAVAAPYCTQLLAGLGARVIKIEAAPAGDRVRAWGPFPDARQDPETGAIFNYVNAGKESLVLDLSSEGGFQTLRALLARADVFVHDRPIHEAQRLRLDGASLRALNPQIIAIAVTPFGLTGPCRDWKGHNLNISHVGVEGSQLPKPVHGGDDELTQRPPVQSGRLLCDYDAGLHAASAAVAGLLQRDHTGAGCHIDLARQEVELSLNRISFSGWFGSNAVLKRGTRETVGVSGAVMCKDGLLSIGYNHDHAFKALAEMMGRPDLINDPRFATRPNRLKHGAELLAEVSPWAAQFATDELYHAINHDGTPTCYFASAEEVVRSPQFESRGFFRRVEHPRLGQVLIPTAAYRMSATPVGTGRAPLLGEHTTAVLRELRKPAPAASAPPPGRARPLPLAGYRILDFTWVGAGPYAAELLAMLGAEVIKIESGARLDSARLGFFFLAQTPDRSHDFNCLNLNKLGIRVNLASEQGRALIRELAALSDGCIDAFRAGTLPRIGLGYEQLRRLNPSFVMLSLSSYGATGPLSGYPGNAGIFAAMSGVSHLTGYPDQAPSSLFEPPDLRAGATALLAFLAALRWQRLTGQGQFIDLSATEANAALIGDAFVEYGMTGRSPSRQGNDHWAMAPHNSYPCKGDDAWISIAIETDEEWRALCEVARQPSWASDVRFATAAGRLQHRRELDALIAGWTSPHAAEELAQRLQAAGVPATPMLTADRLAHDGHVLSRGIIAHLTHPAIGETEAIGMPWRIDGERPAARAAPLLGQHNPWALGELLGEHGGGIDQLSKAGALT